MTAYRVVDDHKDLDNVGSLTHDQIDNHVNTTPFVIVSGTAGNTPANARFLTGSGVTITDGGPGGNLLLTVTGGGGSASPAGNDTEVQFNDGGAFGSDPSFTYNKNTNTLTVDNLSGSLTRLSDGTSYLIAGNNVTIVTGSNGSITISSTATGGGGVSDFFDSTTAGSIFTTGSAAFRGQESIDSPSDKGSDVFFYVSGSTNGADKSLFGGNVVVSGSAAVLEDVSVFGTTKSYQGFSGSLTKLTDGTSYLIAGNNVIIATGSNGSITISSTASGSGAPGGVDTNVQFNDGGSFGGDTNFTFNKATSTLTVDNLSGSLTKLADGSSYLVAGTNVTIATGSNGSITISAPTLSILSQVSWMEIPTGDTDGINMVFTLAYSPSPANSLMFYVNGVLQRQGLSHDYDLSSNTVIMNYSPASGSNLAATYTYTFSPLVGMQTSWMDIPPEFADGVNSIFTLSNTPMPLSALMFYVNGVLQRQGVSADYTISSNTVTMNYVPNSGSNVIATYPY